MKRVIVAILKKHLYEGYKRYDDEFEYYSPLGLMNWEIKPEFPGDNQILRIAEEIIVSMWGAKAKDIVKIPSKEQALEWLKDNLPYEDIAHDEDFCNALTDSLIEWLKIL